MFKEQGFPHSQLYQKMRYIGINLTMKVKDLYPENYDIKERNLKKMQINRSIYHVYG